MTTGRPNHRSKTPGRAWVGIALAGGGPVGAIYELGVLRALEDALDGVTLTDLDVCVGVSAGGFIAAALANGIAPKELYRIVITSDSAEFPFKLALDRQYLLKQLTAEEYQARVTGILELLES